MFGSKSKGVFVDLIGDSVLIGRTTSTKAPFVVDELREFPLADTPESQSAIRDFCGCKGAGFVPAVAAVYPASRLVARLSIEPRKFREDGYLSELIQESLKIGTSERSLVTISPQTGMDLSNSANPPREILVAGALTDELARKQDDLLELGIYPSRMEIGTVAAIGGVVDYLRFVDSKVSTLILEVGCETTNVLIVTREGVEIARSVTFGIHSMIPQIQRELALKDEESARKLFYSNSFDFTGMGAQLTKRLVRELQASIGFYEVQTGQSVSQLCCTLVPSKVAWLERTLADVLGMKVLTFDYREWLKSMGIELGGSVDSTALGSSWTGLMCLMGQYKGDQNEAAA